MNALCSLRTYEQPTAGNLNKFRKDETPYQLRKTGSSYQSAPVWQPVPPFQRAQTQMWCCPVLSHSRQESQPWSLCSQANPTQCQRLIAGLSFTPAWKVTLCLLLKFRRMTHQKQQRLGSSWEETGINQAINNLQGLNCSCATLRNLSHTYSNTDKLCHL